MTQNKKRMMYEKLEVHLLKHDDDEKIAHVKRAMSDLYCWAQEEANFLNRLVMEKDLIYGWRIFL